MVFMTVSLFSKIYPYKLVKNDIGQSIFLNKNLEVSLLMKKCPLKGALLSSYFLIVSFTIEPYHHIDDDSNDDKRNNNILPIVTALVLLSFFIRNGSISKILQFFV